MLSGFFEFSQLIVAISVTGGCRLISDVKVSIGPACMLIRGQGRNVAVKVGKRRDHSSSARCSGRLPLWVMTVTISGPDMARIMG